MELVRDKRVKDAYMVETLWKMFDRGDLRKDHPFQRKPASWSTDYRDGFVATMIKQEDVDSIKICEQLTDIGVILWVIDGGHRLTTLTDYKNNAFKIGNKIDMPIIKYQTSEKYKNGETIHNTVEYDLRGKRYSDLPDELKEKFDNCKIDIVKHLDCTDEEIAYHIRRYNKQKSMNVSQTSVTYMEKTAQYLKGVSTNNRFFKDCGTYGERDRSNGTTDRIVMESVMCMFHLDNWKKSGRAIAEYIDEFSSEEEFKVLDSNLKDLTSVITEDIDNIFNIRDSFVWFTLFNKCLSYEKNKEDFAKFLKWFNMDKKSNEKFAEINDGGTKDKKVIIEKLKFLDSLMCEYLDIDKSESNIKTQSTLDFVRENVGQDIEQEDIVTYEDSFKDYVRGKFDKQGNQIIPSNYNAIISIIAYAFNLEEDDKLEGWLESKVIYGGNINQVDNYNDMVRSFDKYIDELEKNNI